MSLTRHLASLFNLKIFIFRQIFSRRDTNRIQQKQSEQNYYSNKYSFLLRAIAKLTIYGISQISLVALSGLDILSGEITL